MLTYEISLRSYFVSVSLIKEFDTCYKHHVAQTEKEKTQRYLPNRPQREPGS
jgi:hypothetical protein